MKNVKHLFIYIFPLIFLSSCVHKPEKETIDELLLFGYMGFCYKDSITKEYDSTKLEIRQYFEYKRDSFARIQTRYYSKPAQYYALNSGDTLGFNILINKMLVPLRYKTKHVYNLTSMYDGPSYSLYYKTSKGKENIINYIPTDLPDSLKVLHDYILNLVESHKLKNGKKFEFNRLTTSIAKKLFRKHPPPIESPSTIKFDPPK